jgi:hypothetical protein
MEKKTDSETTLTRRNFAMLSTIDPEEEEREYNSFEDDSYESDG